MCCLFYYCTGMNSIPGAILHEPQSCSASTSILGGPFVVSRQDKGKWMMASLLWLLRGVLCLLKRLFGGCRRMWIPNILGAGVLPPGPLLSHAEAVGLEMRHPAGGGQSRFLIDDDDGEASLGRRWLHLPDECTSTWFTRDTPPISTWSVRQVFLWAEL